MTNLVDKLVPKVDLLRQTFADKFGLPSFNLYQIQRTWDGGEVGAGNPTSVTTQITPTPTVKFSGGDKLLTPGRNEDRTMTATNLSLTFTEGDLTGDPKSLGVELFYKLVARNSQTEVTTYWILSGKPEAQRGKVGWKLPFKHYDTTE